ncbi:hypothetical protein CK203_106283 [Vitis vinifera]|uniref:Uncharacterized protein n=1 Tax=Vitis vinifera TaxID=29760 RepID=A0A438BPT6_VITVI|nr:hypothetical protein CK203_106283 [Vitis vinifera]
MATASLIHARCCYSPRLRLKNGGHGHGHVGSSSHSSSSSSSSPPSSSDSCSSFNHRQGLTFSVIAVWCKSSINSVKENSTALAGGRDSFGVPARVARKCGPRVNTLRIESPWRVLRAWLWKSFCWDDMVEVRISGVRRHNSTWKHKSLRAQAMSTTQGMLHHPGALCMGSMNLIISLSLFMASWLAQVIGHMQKQS